MQDIKPDTSPYNDTPDRLRALAAVLESAGEVQSSMRVRGTWVNLTKVDNFSISAVVSGSHDVRIKPKPRELWKLAIGNTFERREFVSKESAEGTRSGYAFPEQYSVVRFVEQLE